MKKHQKEEYYVKYLNESKCKNYLKMQDVYTNYLKKMNLNYLKEDAYMNYYLKKDVCINHLKKDAYMDCIKKENVYSNYRKEGKYLNYIKEQDV